MRDPCLWLFSRSNPTYTARKTYESLSNSVHPARESKQPCRCCQGMDTPCCRKGEPVPIARKARCTVHPLTACRNKEPLEKIGRSRHECLTPGNSQNSSSVSTGPFVVCCGSCYDCRHCGRERENQSRGGAVEHGHGRLREARVSDGWPDLSDCETSSPATSSDLFRPGYSDLERFANMSTIWIVMHETDRLSQLWPLDQARKTTRHGQLWPGPALPNCAARCDKQKPGITNNLGSGRPVTKICKDDTYLPVAAEHHNGSQPVFDTTQRQGRF